MYRAIIKLKDKKIKTDLKDFSSLQTINEINNKSELYSRRDEYDGDDYYDDEYDHYSTSLKGLFKKNKEIKIKLKKGLNGEYEGIIKVLGKKIKLDFYELPTIYTFEPISKHSQEFYDFLGIEDHLISYQTNVNSFLKDNEEITITIFKRYKYYYYEDGRVMVKDRPLSKRIEELESEYGNPKQKLINKN